MSISYDRTLTAHHISGWWYTYPSEKYEFVSWIYSSQYDGKNNPNVPNHQPNVNHVHS
jgi:hypothetical protein